MSCFSSTTFKVVSLGCFGVAVMMAIALSLASTLGAPPQKSLVAYSSIEGDTLAVTSYTKPYIAGRPWRKTNDVIGNDKQCGIVACKGVAVEGSEAKCTWTVGDMLGQAVYYFRALGADESGAFVTGVTNSEENFQIDVYNGRTTSIIIAVIVMSCIAWAILIGGLIMERMKKIE